MSNLEAQAYELDLDALSGQTKLIKFRGKGVEVRPPSVKQYMALMRLENYTEKPTGDDLKQFMIDVKAGVGPSIPADLANELEDLEFSHIMGLVYIVGKMGASADSDFAAKLGIAAAVDPKKNEIDSAAS